MKSLFLNQQFVLGGGACALAIVLLAGCSPAEQASSSSGQTQNEIVQGEPIQGEPIAAPLLSTNETGSGASNELAAVENEGAQEPAPIAANDEKPEFINGFLTVSFDQLASFEFEMEGELTTATNAVESSVMAKDEDESQIPETVQQLDLKRVALKGFMLPLKVKDGLVTEMLLMRDQSMCCYGATPKINEWVSVKMTEDGVKAIMDQPVTLFGTLHVGEMRENGYLVGIYEMDGESMAGPLDL